MTRAAASLGLALACALAAGCGASIAPPADGDQLLEPDATGWVDGATTGTTGIEGQWHAYADPRFGVPAGDCQTTAYGECSIVSEPAAGATFAPTAGLGMCTSGIIARWISGSRGLTPDYSPGWAGIVLELGQPYDAEAHGVTGFAFDINVEPPATPGLLVTTVGPEESSPAGTPTYWGGARLDASPVHAGHNEFKWGDVGPGQFVATRLFRIGFLVAGNDAEAVSYAFCIDHLTALRSPGNVSPLPASDGQLLAPDATGWVARSTTGETRIQGLWFAAADSSGPTGPPGECQKGGHPDADCSVITEPSGMTFLIPPTQDLGICTSGIVAKGADPYDGIWGAMIGFLLNVTDPPEQRSDPYDADRYGVTGFAFDIDSEPAPGELRVTLETEETPGSGASWGGASADWSPVHAGHNEFKWADVGGPYFTPNPPRLDTTKLTQIGFNVLPSNAHAASYRFCIKNLTALRH